MNIWRNILIEEVIIKLKKYFGDKIEVRLTYSKKGYKFYFEGRDEYSYAYLRIQKLQSLDDLWDLILLKSTERVSKLENVYNNTDFTNYTDREIMENKYLLPISKFKELINENINESSR